MTAPLTLFDKLWTRHEIVERDGESLLWVDRHYVHEGSFHAFSRLKERGAAVAEPELTFGVADHYVPTRGRGGPIANPEIAHGQPAGEECRRSADFPVRAQGSPPGHRARGRPGIGVDAAGAADRLRRQPHLDT